MCEFPIPTGNSGPDGITAGPDGNLWFTESRRRQDRDDRPDDACRQRVPHPLGPVRHLAFRARGSRRAPTASSGSPNTPAARSARSTRRPTPSTSSPSRPMVPRRRTSPPAPTATSGSQSPAANQIGTINPTTHAISGVRPRPGRRVLAPGHHGGARRQPLVHRSPSATRSARSTRRPTSSRTFSVPTANADPYQHHGGSRRQPLVHRARRQPGRDHRPDRPCPSPRSRPAQQFRARRGSPRVPTAISG